MPTTAHCPLLTEGVALYARQVSFFLAYLNQLNAGLVALLLKGVSACWQVPPKRQPLPSP
jgi:hypothetical protein